MKKTLFALSIALFSFLTVNTVQAQNAKFTDVVFSEDGLTVSGKITGLGNKAGQTVEIYYSTGVVTTTIKDCINNGGNVVIGQREIFTLGASQVYVVPGRNGHINFSLTLETSSLEDMTCPNNMTIRTTEVEGLSSSSTPVLSFTTGLGATGYYSF
jgi:hypothetical protein